MKWFSRKEKSSEPVFGNKEQRALLKCVATFDRMEKSGLLLLDLKEKRVVITSTLAAFFLKDRKSWNNFLDYVQWWFIYRISQDKWNRVSLDAEVKAVRAARKKYATLSKVEEKVIRQRARAGVEITEVPLPKVEPYDFVLCDTLSGVHEPEIFSIGHYENGKFDMVTFEEVEKEIQEKE